jgi:hypothetical protein
VVTGNQELELRSVGEEILVHQARARRASASPPIRTGKMTPPVHCL